MDLQSFLATLVGTPHPKDDWKFPASYLRIGRLPGARLRGWQRAVDAIPESTWAEEKVGTLLSEYLGVVILSHHGQRHRLWETLGIDDLIAPLLDTLGAYYGGGYAVLVALDRLAGGTTIPAHRDGPVVRRDHVGELPGFFRRTHTPIRTSPEVEFVVAGDRRHLAPGEIWEINNGRVHHVENRAESARVHLVVDWDAPLSSRRDGH